MLYHRINYRSDIRKSINQSINQSKFISAKQIYNSIKSPNALFYGKCSFIRGFYVFLLGIFYNKMLLFL